MHVAIGTAEILIELGYREVWSQDWHVVIRLSVM